MNAPALCPSCRAAGIIATRAGPTCTHGERTGAAWFPPWWGEKETPEAQRTAWLHANLSSNPKPLCPTQH